MRLALEIDDRVIAAVAAKIQRIPVAANRLETEDGCGVTGACVKVCGAQANVADVPQLDHETPYNFTQMLRNSV